MTMMQGWQRGFEEAENACLKQFWTELCGYYLVWLGAFKHENIAEARFTKALIINPTKHDDSISLIADYQALPFKAHSIDTICLSHVLDISSEPSMVLQTVQRALRLDGYLIVTGLNRWRHRGRRLRQTYLPCLPITNHRLPGYLKVLSSLYEAGFEPVTIKHFGMLSRLQWLDRLLTRYCPSFAVGYAILAKRNVTSLTPLAEEPLTAPSFAIEPALEVNATARYEKN